MKRTLLIFILFLGMRQLQAQCENPTLLTAQNIQSISNPYQLTFLHQFPKNKVDTAVLTLMETNIKHIIDERAVIESIGETKSDEGFKLLYTCCTQNSIVDDLTSFGTLCAKIKTNGGFKVLNKFYLNDAVSNTLPETSFNQEVLNRCAAKKSEIYYCDVLAREITTEELQQRIDSSFSDYVHCTNPVLVTKKNINSIHNPYELTFLNKIPKNTVDSCVIELMNNTAFVSGQAIAKRIAETKSQEAFYLLYVCAATTKNPSQEHFYHLANSLDMYGAHDFLNKYFLDSAVSKDMDFVKYRNRVVELCAQKNPQIYYCHQPTIYELYSQEIAAVNIKKYDRKIIRIIKNNSRYTNKKSRTIFSKVMALPFVQDVLSNGCYEHLAIYPGYSNLMVKMFADGKIVERNYHVLTSKLTYFTIRLGKHVYFSRKMWANDNRLDYKSVTYCPECIKKAREYCEEKKNRGE